jgi:hypothetical protein
MAEEPIEATARPLRDLSLRGTALTLFGLGAFALTQPIFDLLAGNVEFLIAHRIDSLGLLIVTSLLAVVPGTLAFLVMAFTRWLSVAAARIALASLTTVGVAATALPPLHRSVDAPGLLLRSGAGQPSDPLASCWGSRLSAFRCGSSS